MDEDMKLSPMNRSAKPMRISPASFFLWFFIKSTMTAPMPKRRGAKNSGFSASPHSLMDTIQLVTVVPILAPMMMPTAWVRLMMPALTKPTTMTVVAEELWIMAVTAAPTRTPSRRLLVSTPRSLCILWPAER